MYDTEDFQVGDWVRCRNAHDTHGLELNKRYMVTYTDGDKNLPRRILKFNGVNSPGYYAHRFVRALPPMEDTRAYLEVVAQ